MNSFKDIGDTITNDMVNDTTSPSTTLLSTVNLKHMGMTHRMKHNVPKRNGISLQYNISVSDYIFCEATCLGESPQKHFILILHAILLVCSLKLV